MTDADKAMGLRAQTLNCISEEMYEKPSFRDAIKNGQRCLIPFKGCFEWRWLDEKGTIKVPYFIDFQDESFAHWRDYIQGGNDFSDKFFPVAAHSALVHSAYNSLVSDSNGCTFKPPSIR